MNEIYKKNKAIIERAMPPLAKRLSKDFEAYENNPDAEVNGGYYRVVQGALATQNLLVVQQSKQNQFLMHDPDGPSEAIKILRETKMKNPQLVFFFGLGLGYLLEEFKAVRTKETFGLCAIEPDAQVFLRLLSRIDISKDLADPNNVWLVGYPIDELKYQLCRFFEHHNTVNRSLKILPTPRAMMAHKEYFEEIGSYFMYARDQATIWSGNSIEDSFNGVKNVLNNMELLLRNPGLATLKDQFKGKTCISVAAGPGVNDAWDTLRRLQGKVPIIACDTLVKPFNKQGVQADFITALERDPIVADMFRGHTIPERSALVGPSLLLPDSFECYKGRHIAYSAAPPYSSQMGFAYLGVLAPGSSAGNLNIALATYLGFSNIIMIGHNLAYALGSWESHVKGTIDKSREEHRSEEEMSKIATGGKVITADEKDHVYTLFEYNLFRSQIENLIGVSPETKFFNTTAKGARILGATYKPLQEALDETVTEDFDIYPQVLELTKEPASDVLEARRKYVLKCVGDAVESLESAEEENHKMVRNLEKWRSDIEVLEAQGKKWSIEKLNSKLDELLSFKVRYVNEDRTFNDAYVSVISPGHHAFEREINELRGLHDDNYELKKDFLLRHTKYFSLWERWIPKVKAKYREAYERMGGKEKKSATSSLIESTELGPRGH
jgi:hypothetical protein